jgi:polyisoprenoid-binding protein YceI
LEGISSVKRFCNALALCVASSERRKMKSRLQHLVQLTGNGLRPALLALALTGLTVSMAANAQETWRVDPQHSVARLYFGRGSQAFEIGVVRITGDVVFDSKDPANSTVRLSLQPADRFRADYAEISFTSKQSTMRSDGKLAVTGDLSVTRVNRSVTMEPNEAYHGPVYGEPVAYTDNREITLVFSNSERGAVHYEIM